MKVKEAGEVCRRAGGEGGGGGGRKKVGVMIKGIGVMRGRSIRGNEGRMEKSGGG